MNEIAKVKKEVKLAQWAEKTGYSAIRLKVLKRVPISEPTIIT